MADGDVARLPMATAASDAIGAVVSCLGTPFGTRESILRINGEANVAMTLQSPASSRGTSFIFNGLMPCAHRSSHTSPCWVLLLTYVPKRGRVIFSS